MEFIKRNYVLCIIVAVIAILTGLATLRMLTQLETLVANTTAQKQLTQKQLNTATKQLQIAEQQLAVAKEQLDISKQTLQVASQSRDISGNLLLEVQSQHGLLQQSLNTQQQLLSITQALLQEARSINQKTPESFRLVP